MKSKKDKKSKYVDESEWKVFENTHEAIIDQDTYDNVQHQSCQLSSFTIRERHNERKNEQYFNGDVLPERSNMNIHFKRHFKEDGTQETYQETFNRMLEEKTIVNRGTKPDAKLFCEMVLDINTTYFEERGI